MTNGVGGGSATARGGTAAVVTGTPSNGGVASTAAVTHTGGAARNPGTAGDGGATITGGGASAGTALIGGGVGFGGTISAGGTGFVASTGDVANAGGTAGFGGVGIGGMPVDGASETGGTPSGGAMSTGGAVTAGGAMSTGGAVTAGGAMSTGGTQAGGSAGTGVVTSVTTAAGGTAGTTGGCTTDAWQPPELLTGLEMDAYDLSSPSLSSDGLTLYFAASPLLGGDDKLYYATRTDRGAVFSKAIALTALDSAADDGSPCIASDGLSLYFYSTRYGGLGDRDLWVAKRSNSVESFGDAAWVPNVNGALGDHLPWLSRNQLTLVFCSARSGEDDLYWATRASTDDAFTSPLPIPGVNSESQEGRAALSSDGLTIYFVSSRASGSVGDKDIWFATRPDPQGTFSSVQNLTALNSTAGDIDVALSADESEMFMASRRGASARFEIYRSNRSCR